MITGALDTSGGFSLAIANGQKTVLDYRQSNADSRDSRQLACTVKDRLKEAELNVAMVTRWTVGTGPGSFTGIRTGLAFIAGVCLQTAAEYRGLPSSMALALRAGGSMPENECLAVLNDARQSQFIATVYRKRGNQIVPEINATVVDPQSIPAFLLKCRSLVSVQAEAVRKYLPDKLAEHLIAQPAVDATAFLEVKEWPVTRKEREESLEPIYVRPPVFTPPLNRLPDL